MNKKLMTAMAALLLTGSAAFATDLPYAEDFASSESIGTEGWMPLDANEDGKTFSHTGYYGYNWTGGVLYPGSDAKADDYLFSPAINLEAGKVYTLSYKYKVSSSGTTHNIDWMLATDRTAEAATATVNRMEAAYNWGTWGDDAFTFSVETDGVYYLAAHNVTDAGQGYFYIDDITISAGINGSTPAAPTAGTPKTATDDEKVTVTFDITAPQLTYLGNPITDETVTISVLRNDATEPVQLTCAPGATVQFTDPDALMTEATYTVVCISAEGEGQPLEVTVKPLSDRPKAVSAVNVEQEKGSFIISWDAVTERASSVGLFIPSLVTYTVRCGNSVIADDISETSVAYNHPLPEAGQDELTFSVTAQNAGGEAQATTSGKYYAGNPYTCEYAESFAKYTFNTRTWVYGENASSTWATSSYGGIYPMSIDPQDDDMGMLKFSSSSIIDSPIEIASPLINAGGIKNPIVKLWVYQYASADANTLTVSFRTPQGDLTGGEPVVLNDTETDSWRQFSFPVPADATADDFRIVLTAVAKGGSHLCIDNITMKDYPDYGLTMASLTAPEKAKIGETITLTANLHNKGLNEAEGYTVTFALDGEAIATTGGKAIASQTDAAVSHEFHVTPALADRQLNFTAKLQWEADEDTDDNSGETTVMVSTNDYPAVSDLAQTDNEGALSLTWTRPEISTEGSQTFVQEGFESYDNGATELEGWTFVNANGEASYGFGNLHYDEVIAATVADCAGASSSLKALVVPKRKNWSATNDDWIILPEIIGGSVITLYDCAYHSYGYYAAEYDVCYSTGGTEPEDFNVIEHISTKADSWTERSFPTPDDATRFAIHVTNVGCDALMLDDFAFFAGTRPLQHTGYNVYRNDVKIATTEADATGYELDRSDPNGFYYVSVVYDRGESTASNVVTINIPTHSLTLAALDAPETAGIGQSIELSAGLHNNGLSEATGYKVVFTCGEETIATIEGKAIAPQADATVIHTFDAEPRHAGSSLAFAAELIWDDDENTDDNRAEAIVNVVTNDYPTVSDLKGSIKSGEARLTWSRPAISDEAEGMYITGYNVYRNDRRIASTEADETNYVDSDEGLGDDDSYYVTVVYNLGESMASNVITKLITTGISPDATSFAKAIVPVSGGIIANGFAGHTVTVYDMAGRIVYCACLTSDNETVSLPKGVYVVNTDGNKTKLTVK